VLKLLTAAILILCATSASTSAKPCLSPEVITARSSDVLRYRIEGNALDTFRENFSIVLAKKSPDTAADLLLIFGRHDAEIWIVQGFKNGCQIGTRLTETANLRRVLFGGTI
jgi:hypothetical protein